MILMMVMMILRIGLFWNVAEVVEVKVYDGTRNKRLVMCEPNVEAWRREEMDGGAERHYPRKDENNTA